MRNKLLCVEVSVVAAITIQLAELLNFSVPWVYLQNGDNDKVVERVR